MERDISRSPNSKNALWFFVALLVGGLSIWFTKAAFDNQWYAALVAGFVVLVLTFYYVFNDDDSPEEEGDNVYYLGLLFTLISLIFALVELFGAGAVSATSAQQVRTLLENFGIALTSTVFGIVGRILVQNWQTSSPRTLFFKRSDVTTRSEGIDAPWLTPPTRKPSDDVDSNPYGSVEFDPIDYPEPPSQGASADELAQFNRHILGMIARDLSQGANALARFHTIVRRHASDVQEQLDSQSKALQLESFDFKNELEKNAREFANELRTMSEENLNNLRRNFDSVVKQAEDLQKSTRGTQEQYLDDVRTMVDSFIDAIQTSSATTIKEIARNSNLNIEQIRSVQDALQRVGSELANFSDGLQSANRASERYSADINQVSEVTESLMPDLKRFSDDISQFREGITAILATLDSVREIDQRIQASLDSERSASDIHAIGEALGAIARESRSAPQQVEEASKLFGELREGINSVEQATEKATKALLNLAEHATMQIDTLQKRKKPFFSFLKRR